MFVIEHTALRVALSSPVMWCPPHTCTSEYCQVAPPVTHSGPDCILIRPHQRYSQGQCTVSMSTKTDIHNKINYILIMTFTLPPVTSVGVLGTCEYSHTRHYFSPPSLPPSCPPSLPLSCSLSSLTLLASPSPTPSPTPSLTTLPPSSLEVDVLYQYSSTSHNIYEHTNNSTYKTGHTK